MFNKKLTAIIFLFLIRTFSMAGEMESIKNMFTPLPMLEVGKIKYISINDLPAELRNLADQDMKKNSIVSNSYSEISDDAIFYMKDYSEIIKKNEEINNNLTFKLSNLSKGELSTYHFEGAYPEGPTKSGPWCSVTRVFKRNDGIIVTLHEWDYVGDGGGVVVINELMNTKVSDIPARFSIKKSPSGEIISELTWITTKKYFTLTIWGDVVNSNNSKINREWMNGLAATIR